MTAPIQLLLLEDDPADARLVELMLRRLPGEPFAVATVNRLSVALDRVAGGAIDVVLADLSLPDSAGLSTLTALTEASPNMPVVVLTGNDDDTLALEALKHGAQDYLVKGKGDAAMLARVIRYAIERKAGERALKEARDRAEAAAHTKSVFLAMVGHEIRTPLNGILGMARLLLESQLDARQRTFADTVVSSGELLLGLVNDILDFSRLEAEGLSLESVPFGVIDTVEDMRLMLAPRAADKGLTLGLRLGSGVPSFVIGDPLRLRQVLLNLVGNAIKFTDEGHVMVSVEALGDGDKVRLRFVVTDTGIGIPEAARADLFTEFWQGDNSISRRFGGAGLGLAICKRLARLMGGALDFDSVPGRGTTFWFEVPFIPTDEIPDTDHSVPATAKPCRILLVDDNAVNREVALGLLERHGHTVVSAEGGYQGIAAWEDEGPFDLVLLDMHMPDLDGIETGRALRAMGGDGVTVPVYLLTANPLQLDSRVWREAGIDGCLGKPFRVEEVVRLLGKAGGEGCVNSRVSEAALVGLPDLLADLKDLGRDRMAGLVDLFRRTSAQDLETAVRLTEAGDLAQLGLVVHRMASAAFSLHLIALALHCRAIEDSARAEHPNALKMAANLPDLWKASLAALGDVVSS